MAEYIEREKAIKAVMSAIWERGSDGAMAMEIVASVPAADVRPERHGEWLYCGDGYECSECGGDAKVNTNPFCWKCGAKMDGKDIR